MNKYNIDFFYMHFFTMRSQCVLNWASNQDAHYSCPRSKYIAKITCGCFPTSTRNITQKSEIFRHKTSHMVLSIIFLEDKHNILLHLSIFYEYQQFFQHRICFSIQPQLQIVNLHRNRRHFVIKLHTWFFLSYFVTAKINFYCIYQYFMSINSLFNTVSVSRYSRPITVTRDPDQHVPSFFC